MDGEQNYGDEAETEFSQVHLGPVQLSDDESDTEESGLDPAQFQAQSGIKLPTIVDPGQVIYEQGVRQKHQVATVASNVEKSVQKYAFDTKQYPVLVIAWLAVMMKIAEKLGALFLDRFHEVRGQTLTLGTVMQFLITLKFMLANNFCVDSYFEDRNAGDGYKALSPIAEADFRVLFALLDEPDVLNPERRFRFEYTGNKRCKEFAEEATTVLRTLFKGAKSIDLCTDDLMIGNRNCNKMYKVGLSTAYNPRKAVRNGVTMDVTTACPRLNIAVSILLNTIDDRKTGKSRSERIRDDVRKFREMGTNDIHVTLDRGFEDTSYMLACDKIQITATSQRGGVRRQSIPFTYSITRPLPNTVRNIVQELPKENASNLTFSHWRVNKFGNVPVLHGAFGFRKGQAPVLMKTTNLSLENQWIMVPKSGTSSQELANAYKAKLASSTSPQPVPELAGSSSTAAAGAPDPSGFLTKAEFETFLNLELAGTVMLTPGQRSVLWFAARRAISSTTLVIVVRWHVDAVIRSMIYGENNPTLGILSEQLLEADALDEARAGAPGYDAQYDEHIMFLGKALRQTEPSIPEAFAKISGSKLESASGSDLHAAMVARNITPRPKKKGNTAFSVTEVSDMKMRIGGYREEKYGTKTCDLAGRIIGSWSSRFPGNIHTLRGQSGEEDAIVCLPKDLAGVEFKFRRSDGEGDEIIKPFLNVSPVSEVGCMAPTIDSCCVASVDGIFASQRFEKGPAEAWVLEIKMKTSANSVAEAASGGTENRYFKVDLDATPEFLQEIASAVSDPSFVLQTLHHAAATRIPRVLLAIGDYFEAKFIRFVAIEWDESLLERHRKTIDYIVGVFLPFLSRPTKLSWGGLTAESLNFNRVLRELAIKAQIRYPEKSIIPVLNWLYNCTKSGVDTLHQCMGTMTSPNIGGIRRVFLALLDAVMISADKAVRAYAVKDDLDDLNSPDALSRALNDVKSHNAMAKLLLKQFSLNMHHKFTPAKGSASATVEAVTLDIVETDPYFKPEDENWRKMVLAKRDEVVAKSSLKGTLIRPDPDSLPNVGRLSRLAEPYFSDPHLSALRVNGSVKYGMNHTWVSEAKRHCDLCCAACEGVKNMCRAVATRPSSNADYARCTYAGLIGSCGAA